MLPFFIVDAFTSAPLGGNPCAVVLDADDLSVSDMQRIAREFNQAETAFVRRSAIADFGVRYFTPAEEIPLAGHPTIATVAALIHCGRASLEGGKATLQLELLHGPITVDVGTAVTESGLPLIRMTQRKPVFGALHDPAIVAPFFGLHPADLVPGAPVQTVSTGVPQLMMLVRDHDALRRAVPPDATHYGRYREGSDFFSPHLFCLGGATAHGATFARHFGIPPDIPEDIATGSATGGMAAYLWRYGYLQEPSFLAEQGHWLDRPSSIIVEVNGTRDDIANVQISGTAAVFAEGMIRM